MVEDLDLLDHFRAICLRLSSRISFASTATTTRKYAHQRDSKNDIQLRLMAAKAAAPYVHRASNSVEQGGDGGGPKRVIVPWQEPA